MYRVNRILIPTDFSDISIEAMKKAFDLAETFQAEVELLHIYSLPIAMTMEPDGMDLPPDEEMIRALAANTEQKLQVLRSSAPDSVNVVVSNRESFGDVAKEICDRAGEYGADMIVIGSHGHEGLLDRLLGSVAEHVVRHAHVQVLVVKPAAS